MRIGVGKRGALDGCRIRWLERPAEAVSEDVSILVSCADVAVDGRKATA